MPQNAKTAIPSTQTYSGIHLKHLQYTKKLREQVSELQGRVTHLEAANQQLLATNQQMVAEQRALTAWVKKLESAIAPLAAAAGEMVCGLEVEQGVPGKNEPRNLAAAAAATALVAPTGVATGAGPVPPSAAAGSQAMGRVAIAGAGATMEAAAVGARIERGGVARGAEVGQPEPGSEQGVAGHKRARVMAFGREDILSIKQEGSVKVKPEQ